jgi:uncharacterized protein (TIGR02145 family)
MKKSILILGLFITLIINLNAQDYLISFAGIGASTQISSVKVYNMTQDKELTLQGDEVLHLKGSITGIDEPNHNLINDIRFYPNPMNDFTITEFDLLFEGITIIELFDFSGRKILQSSKNLVPGRHSYRITGIKNGLYTLRISNSVQQFSGKLLCNKDLAGIPELVYQNTNSLQKSTSDLKSTTSEFEMRYNEGDIIKFIATTDIYSTVIVDTPTSSKKLTFNLVACTDAGGKNYSVVQIGNQIWMAENLAYLPSQSTPKNMSNSTPHYYIYNNYYYNITVTGALYNWPAALKACPAGWHLPTDDEWKQLEMTLGMTQEQANIIGSHNRGTDQGKQMKNGGYYISSYGFSLFDESNNSSGFSGIMGGILYFMGDYLGKSINSCWWSATEDIQNKSWARGLDSGRTTISRESFSKSSGYSVRCVKD